MKKTVLVLLSFLTLASSCSRIDLAVYFADTYVINKTDDYFDLSSEQKKWLKHALKSNIQKVKQIIFPQLAQEFLRAAEVIETQKNVDVEQALIFYQRLKNLIYEGARIFSSDAALFSERLTMRQALYFQKEMDEKLIDMHRDDSNKETYKRYKKHFDSWIGYMTLSQKKSLQSFVEGGPTLTKEKIFNRQIMSHEFIKSFAQREVRSRYVKGVFAQYESMRDPGFNTLAEAYNRRLVGYVASFLNNLKNDQRETLIENLRDRANQLIKISKG